MPPASDPGRARSAGILLHPTSLPGRFGIGDLGPEAYAWVDCLADAHQGWWQVLPLGPTGYGDSPYLSFSAFAGNPNLINPDLLGSDGLVQPSDLPVVSFDEDAVEYGRVNEFKAGLVRLAWERFQSGSGKALRPLFEAF